MENRKTKLTKKIFHETLLELLEEKPLSKISVSELCKKADLNRSTFYSHYEDISFLVREMEQEFIDQVPYAIMSDHSYEAAYSEIQYLQDHLKTFQLLIDKGDLVNAFIEKSMETITPVLKTRFSQKGPTMSFYLLLLNYTVAGFIKAMEYWSYHQDEYTVEQLAEVLSGFGTTISERFIPS